MSRSHKGKLKLDVRKLQKYEAKLVRHIQKLQKELYQTKELIDTLGEAIAVPSAPAAVAPVEA